MYKPLLVIVSAVAFNACTPPKVETAVVLHQETPEQPASGFDENRYESLFDLANYKPEQQPVTSEIQDIKSSCAIIVSPTEEQLNQMEEDYGEDFYTIADDAGFYQAEALMKLDSFQVTTVAANQRFLRLANTSGTWMVDVRKEGAPEWNIILFHAGKQPEILSPVDVTNEKIASFFSN